MAPIVKPLGPPDAARTVADFTFCTARLHQVFERVERAPAAVALEVAGDMRRVADLIEEGASPADKGDIHAK